MGIALQSLRAIIILTVHVFIPDDIPYWVGTLTLLINLEFGVLVESFTKQKCIQLHSTVKLSSIK